MNARFRTLEDFWRKHGEGIAWGSFLLLLNLVVGLVPARWDLTRDRRYTLSAATRGALANFRDPIYIDLFLTPDLPPPEDARARYTRELLSELRSASRRVRVTIVRADTASAKKELRGLGILPRAVPTVADDRLEVREVHIALLLRYRDRVQSIPFVHDESTLEFELTTRLKVLADDNRKTLLLTMGHGELTDEQFRTGPGAGPSAEFRIEASRLSREVGFSPEAVLVVGPQRPLAAEEIVTLDDYLASGTPVLVALNRRFINPQGFRSFPIDAGLDAWLSHYGVRVEDVIVMDPNAQTLGFRTARGSFQTRYGPFVLSDLWNREHPAVGSLDAALFPFCHPVVAAGAETPNVRWTALLRSSFDSWAPIENSSLDPIALMRYEGGRSSGPFTLAALVEGSTVSFVSPRRTVPRFTLAVIGTAFVADPRAPHPAGTEAFLTSLIRYLTGGLSAGLPRKGSGSRPLRATGERTRSVHKSLGRGLPAAALLLVAGIFHIHRARDRARARREFRVE